MGTSNPNGSHAQLTLQLEPGLSARHRSLRACVAAGVYAKGLDRVAVKIDVSPSKLSEKLSGGTGDRKRDIGLDEFERYLDSTDDRTPVLYLIDKYLSDPRARQVEALARVESLLADLPAALSAAGLAGFTKGRR
jgi:hypothetical protein